MMSVMQIRNVVGIIGNVISFGLFLSPVPTFWRIIKNKSVEEFKPDPYLACFINCMLWVFYGLPFNHPNSLLVITINAIGLAIEIIYLIIFWTHGNSTHKKKICLWILAEFIFVGGLAAIDLAVFHTHESRSMFVGICCVIFGIVMYGAPLTIMLQVVKTKSVEFMPFTLSLASFLNGVCWTTYALLKLDLYILVANGAGAILGLMQLILYACYFKTTP
uniref:putative bidirectional sugar transporter SWEET7d n=1 Tax=Erigeron canadensis TaxID=72917 RepID=UPI001CB99574|nr:putative bidirectional sugar transporter SWEET7d [Erigeron canadensis]